MVPPGRAAPTWRGSGGNVGNAQFLSRLVLEFAACQKNKKAEVSGEAEESGERRRFFSAFLRASAFLRFLIS
jgi:hypothetical protein